jgi:murein L,D-transpeptidase YafK
MNGLGKFIKRVGAIITGVLVLALIVYYFYPITPIPRGLVIDKIIILKSQHRLTVYSEGKDVQTYRVSIGRQTLGQKQTEGDLRTPEGQYYICDKNPNGRHHKSLSISYPNRADIERIKKTDKPTGGGIQIHGMKNGMGFIGRFQSWRDWTAGCIALSNEEMDQVFEHTPIGTPVIILP